jgi:hypothetical protein
MPRPGAFDETAALDAASAGVVRPAPALLGRPRGENNDRTSYRPTPALPDSHPPY